MAMLICQLSQAAVKINGVVRTSYGILPGESVAISDNKNTTQPRVRLLMRGTQVIQTNSNNMFFIDDLGSYTLVGYDGAGGILLSTFEITKKLLPKANSFGFAAYCNNLDSFALSCNYPLADSVAWFVDGTPTGLAGPQIWASVQGNYTYDVYFFNIGWWSSIALNRTCAGNINEVKILDNKDVLEKCDRCTYYDAFGREFKPTSTFQGVAFEVCKGERWRKIYVN